jgi:hypothetical protein
MYKDVLRSIEGIEIFPVISLIIFTLFFGGLIFYAMGLRKNKVEALANLPLEDNHEAQTAEQADASDARAR